MELAWKVQQRRRIIILRLRQGLKCGQYRVFMINHEFVNRQFWKANNQNPIRHQSQMKKLIRSSLTCRIKSKYNLNQIYWSLLRVINADCQRSRVNVLTDLHRIELEKIITLLCKKKNLHYKQGLHEIAAPFINFRKTYMSLSEIYTLVELFIDRYLSSVFGDKDFSSLKCCFEILDILMRYHDPALREFLQSNEYPPEIYCTPWFLTLFAQ